MSHVSRLLFDAKILADLLRTGLVYEQSMNLKGMDETDVKILGKLLSDATFI
jgi:hypothetical protein